MLEELLKLSKKFSSGVLKDYGEIIPVVYVHVLIANKMTVIPQIYTKDNQQEIIDIIKSVRAVGIFLGMTFIAEAWISLVMKGQEAIASVLPPRQDPDRVESVVMVAYDRTGEKKVSIYKINRSGDSAELGEQQDPDYTTFNCWLDAAFCL